MLDLRQRFKAFRVQGFRGADHSGDIHSKGEGVTARFRDSARPVSIGIYGALQTSRINHMEKKMRWKPFIQRLQGSE